MSKGIVYFVGAGPGHPGLMTLRGVECLARADVVMYDYLANAQTLCHARPTAKLICLGRHRRDDVWSQDAINTEMVRLAREGKTVVRLKGGDPMIFGRAAEEISALNAAELPFEIVPGVTTASAAGAYSGVPITDRRFASAVALVTGHERLGKPESSLDYQSLATFPGTLVIYMGVRTVAEWTTQLIAAGKSAETPVLAIRRCSWPDQQRIFCTLGEVADQLTPYQKFPPPVVVVIGDVARQQPEFDWFGNLPLLGLGVLVTRPIHQCGDMVRRLSELGANPIVQPAIEICEPETWEAVDDVLDRIDQFDVVVFASANGVHHFMRRLLARGLDVRALSGAKLAVMGPRTADVLAEYSLVADVLPKAWRAEAMAETLLESGKASGQKFLLLRASRGREVLAERLREAGAVVDQVVVYESRDVESASDEVEEFWERDQVHWVTITSSAIARSVVKLWGPRLQQIKLASISPVTSETLRELGFEPVAEATEFTPDGVIDAILKSEASDS